MAAIPLRVLLVEDRPRDAELVVLQLESAGFAPDWDRVQTAEDFLAKLDANGKLDVILSDFAMPQFSGLDALRLLRERGLDIPLIIVSGTIGEEAAVECIKLGATDYLIKDRLMRLGTAVERALQDKRLRDEKRASEEAEHKQRVFAEALVEIAATINSTLDLESVMDAVLANIERVVPTDASSILLYDSGVARVAACRGFVEHSAEEAYLAFRFEVEKTTDLRQMAETRRPFTVPDAHNFPGWVKVPETEWMRAHSGAPIFFEDTLLGFLSIISITPGFFTPEHAERLQTFANQAAVAIKNARLHEELENYNATLKQTVDERTAELQRTKDRVEAILNSVGDALMVVSPDGQIKQVNPAFEQQTGFPAHEAEMRISTSELMGEGSAARAPDPALAAMRAGQSWRGEIVVHRRDGTTYDADVAIAPLKSDEGEVIAFVSSIRDISDLKQVERMKDAFVSNVSHELRTPITSMKLNLNVLAAAPERVATLLQRLMRETMRLERIVEDLLRLSRLDQARESLLLAPADLAGLAQQYVDDRTLLAESRGIKLSVRIQPDLPQVQIDAGLLGQALSVLLTNALNYTPAGGRVVVKTMVKRPRRRDGQTWVGLGISDTGPGIAPDEQGALFERFFRGRAGRDSGQAGTGLGLAIAKEIVDRHQGRIEVISTGVPGEGTTFNIWLPLEQK